MIFALELSDNVDPTALATAALAVQTFAAVVIGGLVKDHGNSPGVIMGIPHPPGGW
jgi:hypothetical protein